MAVTTEISWGDGTSDKIYLTRNASEGNQIVLVSSDANTGAARSKVVTFSASGVTPVTLTVSQAAGAVQPVFYQRLKFDGTAFIQTDIPMPPNGSIAVPLGNESKKVYQVVFNFKPSPGDGNIRFSLGTQTNSSRRQLVPQYDSTSNLLTNTYLNFTYQTYNFFMTPKGMGTGDSFHSFTKGSSHPSGGLCLGFNYDTSASTTQRYTGTAGYIRIFNSDAQDENRYTNLANYTPHRTLRPCLYGGQAGLWCVETNTFYGNSAGAGVISVDGDIVT